MDDVVVALTPRDDAGAAAAVIADLEAQTRPPAAIVPVDDSSGRAHGVNAAYATVRDRPFDFFAVVAADVQLPPDHLAQLVERLRADPTLGLVGGVPARAASDGDEVPGSVQVFRREAWDAIGGYREMAFGGVDRVASAAVRHAGWRTRSYDDLPYRRAPGSRADGSALRSELRRGRIHYDMGYLPSYEAVGLVRRLPSAPYVVGSLARGWGFLSCYLRRLPRHVDPDLIAFIRAEQRDRLRSRT